MFRRICYSLTTIFVLFLSAVGMPTGRVRAAGAWETVGAFAFLPSPEMDLSQGGTSIADNSRYHFRNHVIGTDTLVTFLVTNNGTAELNMPSITITGTDADQFSIVQTPSSPLPANMMSTFVVRFQPTSPGLKTATISIANDDSDENPYDLTITATGIATVTLNSAPANDGWIVESSENSNVGGQQFDSLQLRLGDDAANRQYRSILHFSTASLPDDAMITSVRLRIKLCRIFGVNPFNSLGNIAIDVREGSFSDAPRLQLSDFQTAPHMAIAALIQNTPETSWYSASLDPSAYPFINLTGPTQIRLRFQKDDNNNLIADWLRLYSSNDPNPANHPQLIIEYTIQ